MKIDRGLSHKCERCPRRIAHGRRLCVKCESEVANNLRRHQMRAAKAREKLLGG